MKIDLFQAYCFGLAPLGAVLDEAREVNAQYSEALASLRARKSKDARRLEAWAERVKGERQDSGQDA